MNELVSLLKKTKSIFLRRKEAIYLRSVGDEVYDKEQTGGSRNRNEESRSRKNVNISVKVNNTHIKAKTKIGVIQQKWVRFRPQNGKNSTGNNSYYNYYKEKCTSSMFLARTFASNIEIKVLYISSN